MWSFLGGICDGTPIKGHLAGMCGYLYGSIDWHVFSFISYGIYGDEIGRGHVARLSDVPGLPSEFVHGGHAVDVEYLRVHRHRFNETQVVASLPRDAMEGWIAAHPDWGVYRERNSQPPENIAVVMKTMGTRGSIWSEGCWVVRGLGRSNDIVTLAYDPELGVMWADVRTYRGQPEIGGEAPVTDGE